MKSLWRITPFLRPYTWVLTIGLLLVVLPVVMELVVPWLLQYIIDEGIRTGSMRVITQGSLIMLGSAVLGAVATLGQGVYRAQLSQGIAFDMRNDLFTHIQRLSFVNLDQMQTGQLMTRLASDVNQVRMFLSAGLALLLRALLMIIGSMIMLLLTDWQLGLVVLGLLVLAGVVIRLIMRTATPLFTIVQEKLSSLNTLVQENLAGMQVVKAFVRERFAITQFDASNTQYTDTNIRAGRILALASPLLTILTNVGMVGIVWLGGREVILGGRLSVGELVAFNNYLLIGMAPLLLLSNMLTMVSRAEASSERILEVLDTEPAIQPAPHPHTGTLRGGVTFDQVSFHYQAGKADVMPAPYSANRIIHTNGASSPNGKEAAEVLDRISFTVNPGQRVALLGATGSGKSTLVNLIPRFYDVTGGSICIDGVDVRQWDVAALRRQIGVVLQKTTLFSGTVHENIAYGRPSASRETVIAAAEAAQAHDFILAMPQGYDSRIEERGMNLSGGQKQRIAIARALLVAPTILILDDSTSALDMETEYRLQQALDALMAHCTTFIIAQRINSVLTADQILVLDSGRIVAQGAHRELLATSPIYQEIYRSQLGEQGK
jgi:ATP-binding cassette, subfamily B, multidrug efflux pump